jgi:VWFA-related protein
MRSGFHQIVTAATLVLAAVLVADAQQGSAPDGARQTSSSGQSDQEGFRFRSGVELINVTATVTDDEGRFVSGLRLDDFAIYEDGSPVIVSHFSNERVPVSLGIVLDTSGSMTSEKMAAARGAIEAFMDDLLVSPENEMFAYRFASVPELVQDWTSDRRVLSRALSNLHAGGGTAMYDAIADAVPIAQSGRNRKKALVLVSDGNDTNSGTSVAQLRQMLRQTELLVYAVGVDGHGEPTFTGGGGVPPRWPIPIPIPGRGGHGGPQFPPPVGGGGRRGGWSRVNGDRVNPDALREITDDTGGRTEIVREFSDLQGATARIADELSKQYYFGYASSGKKDGRWHTIKVEVKDRRLRVRARRGYVAS